LLPDVHRDDPPISLASLFTMSESHG
jgi:hypothetical protein